MRIKPGDSVLVPFTDAMDDSTVARIKAHLGDAYPGVTWGVLDGTPMTHAIVYEGDDNSVIISRLTASKLNTALDLLAHIVGTFSDKGSIGGIDNSLRSGWQDVDEVARWQQWIADTRKLMRETGTPR